MFAIPVVLIAPLLAMGLLWTAKKRLGLMLLSLSMCGSFLFGLYHHFLAVGPDHGDSQPWSPWGLAFDLTAYLLLITEATGTYVGIHFLRIAKTADAEDRISKTLIPSTNQPQGLQFSVRRQRQV